MELQEHRKLLYTNFSISDIIFKKESYFEQINLELNDEITKKTDLIYTTFYEKIKGLIIIYIFSFLILGIDLTSFIIALKNHKFLKEKKRNYTIIVCIPGFILWFLTILFLIIYYCKEGERRKCELQRNR